MSDLEQIVKDLSDKDRNIKEIDGVLVEFRISEFAPADRIRIIGNDDPRIHYVIITRTPPSLDQVIIALRQARIMEGRLPVDFLMKLQRFYMQFGELPAEYLPTEQTAIQTEVIFNERGHAIGHRLLSELPPIEKA